MANKTIHERLYLKDLIVTEKKACGWDAKDITKLLQYLYRTNGWVFSARHARGKHSYPKAMAYYQQRKLSRFLPK